MRIGPRRLSFPSSGAESSEHDLAKHCRRYLAPYKSSEVHRVSRRATTNASWQDALYPGPAQGKNKGAETESGCAPRTFGRREMRGDRSLDGLANRFLNAKAAR